MQFSQIWLQIQPKVVNRKTKGCSIIFGEYWAFKISFRTFVWALKVLILIMQRGPLFSANLWVQKKLTLRVP